MNRLALSTVLVVVGLLSIACEDETPMPGDLEVMVETTGSSLDPDGYAFVLDGVDQYAMEINDTTLIEGLPPGGKSGGDLDSGIARGGRAEKLGFHGPLVGRSLLGGLPGGRHLVLGVVERGEQPGIDLTPELGGGVLELRAVRIIGGQLIELHQLVRPTLD